MLRCTCTLITLAAAAASLCTNPANPAVDQAALKQSQAQQLKGLAIAISTPQKYSHSVAYGIESLGVPINTSQTLFRWASVSKTLVGVVAAHLAQQHLVDLTVPIGQYFPAFDAAQNSSVYLTCADGSAAAYKYPGNSRTTNTDCLHLTPVPTRPGFAVTLSRLLSHRAGIQHYSNGVADPSPPHDEVNNPRTNTGMEWAVLKYLLSKPLVSQPGEMYSYSTFGFNLAAVVLEHAANTSFANLVRKFVTQPLCLSTLQPDYEWKHLPHRARGYDARGNDVGSSDVSWKLGGGGWLSSVDEFMSYGASLMGSNWLGQDLKFSPVFGIWADRAEDRRNQSQCAATGGTSAMLCTQYSMGFSAWWNQSSTRSLISVHHTGSQQKAKTSFFLYPLHEYASFAMSNDASANPTKVVSADNGAIRSQLPLSQRDGCVPRVVNASQRRRKTICFDSIKS